MLLTFLFREGFLDDIVLNPVVFRNVASQFVDEMIDQIVDFNLLYNVMEIFKFLLRLLSPCLYSRGVINVDHRLCLVVNLPQRLKFPRIL